MGNQVSYGSAATGKVILLDGSIQEFDKPITVAELMLEYPQQMVVDLKSSTKQKKPTPSPMAADKTLEVDKIYLMVPVRRGKPYRLSPQQAHHIILKVNAMLSSNILVSPSKILPLFAKICPAASSLEDHCKSVAVSTKGVFGSKHSKHGEGNGDDESCLDVFQEPDLLSRQVSLNCWKPSLDTIQENNIEIKKASIWLISANDIAMRIYSKGLLWG